MLLAFTASSANATTVYTLMGDLLSDMGQDSTNSTVTHAQRLRLLTRGQNAVATIIGGIETQTKIALDSAKSDYALGSYWGIEAVMYKTDADYIYLRRVLPEDLGTKKFSAFAQPADKVEGQSEAATTLERYAIFKDTLLVYPALPNMAGDTLYIKGFTAPASLDSLNQTTQMKFWTDDFVVEAAVFFWNKRDLSLADELAWWTSFAQRIIAAQSLYVRKVSAVQQTGVATP